LAYPEQLYQMVLVQEKVPLILIVSLVLEGGGGGRFIACGEKGRMAYSDDGITWIAVGNSTFGSTINIVKVAWGNGRFIAVGEGGMAYSNDGITWIAVENHPFGDEYILAVAWGNNKFVVVGESGIMAISY